MLRALALGITLAAVPSAARAESPTPLRWRPSQIRPVLDLRARSVAEESALVGPLIVDGKLARIVHRLPRPLQHALARPVGPTIIGSLDSVSAAGLGLYVRLEPR